MKRNNVYMLKFAVMAIVVLVGSVSVFAQKSTANLFRFGTERRPFDFSDKSYFNNGVEAAFVGGRHDGSGKQSVFDTMLDPHFRGVRIRSVYPAYNQDGKTVYWNFYGEVLKDGFRDDDIGREARLKAHAFPLYLFPSRAADARFRQAHVINLGNSYFEKNFLGLSVQVVVEFTDRVDTAEGREVLAQLAKQNGLSLDGTPIIKNVFEIEDLTRRNLVTQKIKGLDNPAEAPYAIAKVIKDPQRGAIAPDAFLLNDLGLAAERSFVQDFECLRVSGRWCRN